MKQMFFTLAAALAGQEKSPRTNIVTIEKYPAKVDELLTALLYMAKQLGGANKKGSEQCPTRAVAS